MHDTTTTDRFVTLRASGMSFARLMAELNVSRPTLIAWSRKFQYDIQNFRAIQLAALREQWLADTTERVNRLGAQLRKVAAEIAGRDFASLATGRLYSLADALRRRIEKETGPMKFTSTLSEIPGDEYHEPVQDWSP